MPIPSPAIPEKIPAVVTIPKKYQRPRAKFPASSCVARRPHANGAEPINPVRKPR